MNHSDNVIQMIVALVLASITAGAAAGESLTYDPDTGIYTMEYLEDYMQEPPVLNRAQFELPTRIAPAVKSKVKGKEESGKNLFIYQYEIRNGASSKQDIAIIQLTGTRAHVENYSVPSNWKWQERTAESGIMAEWAIAGWAYKADKRGLKPGAAQSGFGFESRHLPGIGAFDSVGRVRHDLVGFPFFWPMFSDKPIEKQLAALVENNRSVRRLAMAPMIAVPAPFNAAVVLENIRQHVRADVASMQLITPALLSLLDRGLTQAIAVAQGGNTPGLLHEIKSLRQLLKQEHADVDQDNDGDDDDKEKKPKPRIAKLAAKVLDFDLKYVEKRVKGDDD